MKKKFTFFIFLVGSGFLNISIAQTCIPDHPGYTAVPDSGVRLPDPMPNAQVGVYYEQAITIGVLDSTSGYAINWIQYNSLTNYIAGNTWTIVNDAGGSTFQQWSPLTWQCGTLKGTPTIAGTDSIIVFVNANVTIFGFPYTQNNTRAFAFPLIVDPVVGLTNSTDKTDQLQIFPNPFNDNIQINISAAKSDIATLNVYSTLGKLIHSEIEAIQPGENYFSMDGTYMNKGVYVFSVVTSERTWHQNIIKTE